MQSVIEQMKFVEFVFGFTNSMLGFAVVCYVAKTVRNRETNDAKEMKLLSLVRSTLFAMIFLSAYTFFHFFREIFELKEKYGPVVELPEYIFIFFVFIILLGQIMFFDAPDDFFKLD